MLGRIVGTAGVDAPVVPNQHHHCKGVTGVADTSLHKPKSGSAEAQRSRYQRLRAEGGRCPNCSRRHTETTKLCQVCKASRRLRNRTRERDRIKEAALAAYGGAICACCKESDVRFLTLDHVNNDGAAHRRALGDGTNKRAGWSFYGKLRALGWPMNPPIQVLCYNCNNGKRSNGGICPHKEGG